VPELDVDADLRLHLTTSAGRSTTAQVSGAGRELRVDVQRPEVLLGEIDRTELGQLADLLAEAGITVQVVGPHGPAALIGAGSSSRFGKIVTGSSAVAPSLRGTAGIAAGTGAVRATAGVLAAALVVVVVLRRLGRR
jgi:hypothetical protein